MEDLRTYLNSLTPDEQKAFAKRCLTSVGYLRKAISKGEKLNITLCVYIWEQSGGAVTRESLRPDDYQSIWPDLRRERRRSPGRRATDIQSGRRTRKAAQ